MRVIIGLGNTGTQIVKLASKQLHDCRFYAIDSVAASINVQEYPNVTSLPIISDDLAGSGRQRDRGCEMFKLHEDTESFMKMYQDALDAKGPVILISSSAGGTGSGAIVPLVQHLLKMNSNLVVVPFIVIPALEDPVAYHLNTSDMMIELQEAGIDTYAVFRNRYGTADYSDINQEIVDACGVLFGEFYDETTQDTIDDSDLMTIIANPGRMVIHKVETSQPSQLKRLITEKVVNSDTQPWTDPKDGQTIGGFSITSTFATEDYEATFMDLTNRIKATSYDIYKHVSNKKTTPKAIAIVSGLAQVELRTIDIDEYHVVDGMASNVKKSKRPNFTKKRSSVNKDKLFSGIKLVDDK